MSVASAPLGRMILIVTAATLAACSTTRPYQPPTVTTADAWRQSDSKQPAAWPATDWWNAYGSPQLDALISQALHENFDLAAALARMQQADAEVRISGAALLPSIALGGQVSRERQPPTRSRTATSETSTLQQFQSSLASQPYLILAAIVAVYIVLGILYESYVHPLTIISTLPSAGLGALLTLLLFRTDLSVVALIGVILLIGIVKKNGIMMVDVALQMRREQHMEPEPAIRQACLLRFRPIIMTTLAALLGALPLMLEHGTGSELRRPLGYALVGGLLLSQAMTLFTTPVIYLYLDRLNSRVAARMNSGVEFQRTVATGAQNT